MNDKFLADDLYAEDIEQEPIRSGFGRGLLAAGHENGNVVALCADLTASVKMDAFAAEFPERFIEVGIAEQNLVTVAAGMAAMDKVAFCSSYAAFSPGRNWEQIRTTVCLNESNVKVIGSHAGISVGPDGATHQMLEDIALMRVLPNMMVVAPADSIEAEKATRAIARDNGPVYMRLAREATPVFTTDETPFSLEEAQVLKRGDDITLIGTGTMTYQCLVAAKILENRGTMAEVVHVPVIKPLDVATILKSAKKTGAVVTAEEAQIAGGLGGAISELLSEQLPTPMYRIGIEDRFGESGDPSELSEKFGLTGKHIAETAEEFIKEIDKG